ncbi:peptidase [Octadecabacter sp. CECT 8868]|uniref:peptidase n=1 Tax=Octadecabacter algicola TaxID=2909342 RepID=UPI00300C7660|nr:peptidase [Octadecabacter algicola]
MRNGLMALAAYERWMKQFAVVLGVGSTLAVVQGWHLLAMSLSLPFCIIWCYCGWLRTEPQLKWLNLMFSVFYIYGLVRYFVVH